MKRIVHRIMYRFFRTKFTRELDAFHAESRAEVARAAAEGKSWELLQENMALLGIDIKDGKRPKMIFGRGR